MLPARVRDWHPERLSLGQPDEVFHRSRDVEAVLRVARRDDVVDERDGHPSRLEPDALLAVLVDHVVVGVLAGRAGLAVADVGAGTGNVALSGSPVRARRAWLRPSMRHPKALTC